MHKNFRSSAFYTTLLPNWYRSWSNNQSMITNHHNLSFEPLDIDFGKNYVPILSSNQSIVDYEFLKRIFTDKRVMKTSTLFACATPDTDRDLHIAMESLIEPKKEFRKAYGLQKIKCLRMNEYVGVCGLIRTNARIKGCKNDVLELALFMRPEFQNSEYGSQSVIRYKDKLDEMNSFCIASVWDQNQASIKLAQKIGLILYSKSAKTYKDRTINIHNFIRIPNFKLEDYLSTKKVSNKLN